MKNLICSISLLIAQYWNIFGCGQREVSRTRTRCNRIDPRQLHFHGANKVKNCPSTCFLSEGHVAQGGREGGRGARAAIFTGSGGCFGAAAIFSPLNFTTSCKVGMSRSSRRRRRRRRRRRTRSRFANMNFLRR